jgi:hypothetical protein
MITLEKRASMRRGRVFLRDADQPTERLLSIDASVEPEDEARYELLRGAFQPGVVLHGTAHPGVSLRDVMDVYITLPDATEPVFACVVVSEDRLGHMLDEAPVVVEDFCLQVANGGRLIPTVICAALEVWVARNFPGATVPQFNVELWSDANNDL